LVCDTAPLPPQSNRVVTEHLPEVGFGQRRSIKQHRRNLLDLPPRRRHQSFCAVFQPTNLELNVVDVILSHDGKKYCEVFHMSIVTIQAKIINRRWV
jgi:hypothetical protein